MQRLRLTFARSEELKYISHLDLMRLWHRVLRRAGIPIAYSQGFSPHPRLSLAAPLAIGVTSAAELLDVFLERRVSPQFFMKSLLRQLPRGIDLREVYEVSLSLPSLQSQVRFAEYVVELAEQRSTAEVEAAIRSLLTEKRLPWQHSRGKEVHRYDLRALIDDVWLSDQRPPTLTLGMRLRADPAGSGRPEQVAAALGFPQPPTSIHRSKLILASR